MKNELELSWLKEVMIALLALITIGALLGAYCQLISVPLSNPVTDAERTKITNIEKVATALFGIFAAFVGYYSGRVPAEKSAAASRAEAAAERKVSAEKETAVRRATALVAEARDRLGGRRASAASTDSGDGLVERMDDFLNERRQS